MRTGLAPLRPLDAPAAGTIATVAGGGVADGPGLHMGQDPAAVAYFDGSVFIADYPHDVIRKLDLSTGQETRVAGTGVAGYSGDDGPATLAELNDPQGIFVDGSGNLYIADTGNNVIREVSSSTGSISTVAGTGVVGDTGDGGPAATATLTVPDAVTLDAAGTMYISDSGDNVIRKVSSGVISRVAGTGSCADPGGLSGDGGAATSAEICSPEGVAVTGGGDLLIADYGNNAIRKLSGGTLSTVAGTGAAGYGGDDGPATEALLAHPYGVTVDGSGNIVIADTGNQAVREVDPSGVISMLAPDASCPDGVSSDASGDVFVADDCSDQVGEIAPGSGYTNWIAGTGAVDGGYLGDGGAAVNSELFGPNDLTFDTDGNLIISDGNLVLRKIDVAGTISTDTFGGRFTSGADIRGLSEGSDGSLYYEGFYVVGRIPASGAAQIVASTVDECPGGVAVDKSGDVYASTGCAIALYTPDNRQLSFASDYNTVPNRVTALTLSPDGAMYFASYNNSGDSAGIYRMATDGTVAPVLLGLPAITGLAVDADGAIFASEGIPIGGFGGTSAPIGNKIIKIAGSTVSTVAGTGTAGFSGDGGSAAAAELDDPLGIRLDGSGNLYVVDSYNQRVRVIYGAGAAAGATPEHGPYPKPLPDAGLSPLETVGGGQNPSECPVCAQMQRTSQPVNTATGEFWHSFTDLSIPERGPELTLTRTYSSTLARQYVYGTFGYGWSTPFSMWLQSDGNGNMLVHQEDGSTVAFTIQSDGTFLPSQPRVLAGFTTNADGTYTFTRRAREIFVFNSSGQLTSLKDLNGNTLTLAYDPDGYLSTVSDDNGRTLTFTTDNGLVTQVTDGSRTVSYDYDANGNMTSSTDPTGATWTFGYDDQQQMISMLKPDQQGATGAQPLTNTYDDQGRVTQQTDFLDHSTTFDYTSIPAATKTTDPNGNVSVDYYTNGQRTKTTGGYGTPEAATSTFTYDPTTGALASTTDPNGHTTSYTYDDAGNTLTHTDALNHTATWTYDGYNDPLTATDPLGVTTTNTYDSRGNLLTTSTPLTGTSKTQTTTNVYGDGSHPGDVTSMTDPRGKTWTYTYDSHGDRTSSTDPLGNRTSWTYNTLGERISEIQPKGNVAGANPANFTTHYAYDADGRLLSTTDPLGHITTTSYDPDGNTVSTTDPDNHTTTTIYDAADEPLTVTRPDNTSITSTYDADGNQLTQTNAAGKTTTYTYDSLSRLTSTTDPDNQTTHYGYDAVGNEVTVTNPDGKVTAKSYDGSNRLTGISYSDGTTHAVSMSYDADNQRTAMTDGTGTSTWNYDSLNHLTSSTNGAGITVGYGYDLAGNVTALTYPAGQVVTNSYDDAGQMTGVKDWWNRNTVFGYDPDGNLTSQTNTNGTTVSYTFDNADQPTGVNAYNGTTLQASFTRTRDASGLTTGITTGGVGVSQPNQTYGYDSLNQVTSSDGNPLAYDNAGNVTELDNGSALAYDNASRLQSVTPATGPVMTFGYNGEGDRTSVTPAGGASTTLEYDQANRLTSYQSGSNLYSYSYNGDGLRMSKTVNSTTAQFAYDTSGSVPSVLADDAYKYLYGPDGSPFAEVSASGVTTWLMHDLQGSTRILTKNTGGIAGSYTYTPYGSVSGHTGTASTPLQYTGQYTDAETGYQYLRARYYDPATAQFTTPDPLEAETSEPYGYAGGSPLDLSDPSGLCSSWNPVCDAEHASHYVGKKAKQAAHWVDHHKLETAGLVLGAVAAATGVGAVIEGATVLGVGLAATATVTGTAAAALDYGKCVHGHEVAACAAMGLGAVSALAGAATVVGGSLALFGVIEEGSVADAVINYMAAGLGIGLGLPATAIDFGSLFRGDSAAQSATCPLSGGKK